MKSTLRNELTYPLMKKKVTILRGLPSTGKSTYAEAYPNAVVCSADDYFMVDGKYEFVGWKVPISHQWCFGKFIDAMTHRHIGAVNPVGQAEHIIVDNTNTMKWEYQNYIKLALLMDYEFEILNFNQDWTDQELADRNKHGVPAEGINRMRTRWEDDAREKFM